MTETPDPRQLTAGTIRIYTTNFCGYCVAAKRWLTARDIPFEELNVSKDPETRMWLVQRSGLRTVPQIFVGEESIGGYTDMIALDGKGEFMPLLASQGITAQS